MWDSHCVFSIIERLVLIRPRSVPGGLSKESQPGKEVI